MAKTNETGLDKTLDNVVEAAAETNEALAASSNDTGLVANDQPSAQMIFDLNRLSGEQQLEVMRSIVEAEERIDQMGIEGVKSRELIGREFDIINAVYNEIPDEKNKGEMKTVVTFTLKMHDSGEEVRTMKSSNPFNNPYVDYFKALRGVAVKPLANYTFAEDHRYVKNGNPAVVLKRIPKRVNQVAR